MIAEYIYKENLNSYNNYQFIKIKYIVKFYKNN